MKLKKLKMPEDKPAADMESMEGMEELSAMEDEESEDMEAPASSALEAVSDEELMAEMKKRGLMSQMEEPSADVSSEMMS